MRCKIFIFIFLALSIGNVHAIGVSPPSVNAFNLLRGSHFEKNVMLSGAYGDNYSIKIQNQGEIRDWITVLSGEIIDNQIPITISIDVPDNAQNGDYESNVELQIANGGSSSVSGVGSDVKLGVQVVVKASVIGEQIVDYDIPAIRIPELEQNSPITVFFYVNNKGNVAAKPESMEVSIFPKKGDLLLVNRDFSNLKLVEPFSTEELWVEINHDLQVDQYKAVVKIYGENNEIIKEEPVYFDIVASGTLASSGLIANIQSKNNIRAGEVLKIDAEFLNDGQAALDAVLYAEIYFGDFLENVVKSETVRIPIGRKEILSAYANPLNIGEYIIKSYINYNGKRTEMVTTSVLVLSNNKTGYLAPLLLILFIIVLVGFRIRLSKKHKSRAHRKM